MDRTEANRNAAQEEPAKAGHIAPIKLQLLITIVNKNKADFYSDFIQSYESNFQFLTPAHGTANADILDYLGLTDTEKTAIFSVVREDKLDELIYQLGRKFRTVRGGKGIAVSIPFTSVIGTSVYAFLCNATNTVRGDNRNG